MYIYMCHADKMTEFFGSSGLLKLLYSYFVFYLLKEFKVEIYFSFSFWNHLGWRRP